MSLYLTEWLDGPTLFTEFGNFAWKPQVFCIEKPEKPGVVSVFVSFFDLDGLKNLLSSLEPALYKQFITRFDLASTVLIEKMGVNKFLETNIFPIFNATDKDFDRTSEILSELFDMLILDFEFWNKINVIEIYCNLIFYGTVFDPKPLIFIVPPLSEWDDSSDDID